MAKRLFEILAKCNDEEEVKSEFARFFKIKMITHKYKIDLYTNNTLFEFKYDRNFKSKTERAKAIAQTLYYVRKLKFGVSIDPVPDTIFVVDKNEGFFVRTKDFSQFYNANAKYDWDRAASQPCPKLVQALRESDLIRNIHVYNYNDPTEANLFIDAVNYSLVEKLFQSDKKEINEENFESVFEYWCKNFKGQLYEQHLYLRTVSHRVNSRLFFGKCCLRRVYILILHTEHSAGIVKQKSRHTFIVLS